ARHGGTPRTIARRGTVRHRVGRAATRLPGPPPDPRAAPRMGERGAGHGALPQRRPPGPPHRLPPRGLAALPPDVALDGTLHSECAFPPWSCAPNCRTAAAMSGALTTAETTAAASAPAAATLAMLLASMPPMPTI